MHEPKGFVNPIKATDMNYLILFLGITLLACQHKISKEETLPYFNKPDWTPEWISKQGPNFQNIHHIPDFKLVNQNGQVVTQKNVNGKIYVANFFFTNCRKICLKMMDNMFLIQEAYKNDSEIHILSHTVTPEIDSVSVLKKYAKRLKINSKSWDLLTGDKNLIYTLAKRQYFAGDSVGFYQSGNEFLHTENFILIDKHRRIRGVYNGTLLVEIDRIKKDIETLKKEE